jgi:hypothetical protein
MKLRTIIPAILLLGTSPAYAWTYETDDGRVVTAVQANRDGAACNAMALGGVPVPNYGENWGAQIGANIQAGGAMRSIWLNCMRAKGYIVHL